MFKDTPAFSGFSVKDQNATKKFYGETLGVTIKEDKMGLTLQLGNGAEIFVYQKDNHEPATFTILNFVVGDIDKAAEDLKDKGVKLEHYDLGGGAKTGEDGIMRGIAAGQGPDIAWFKDPSGNVLSVLQEK